MNPTQSRSQKQVAYLLSKASPLSRASQLSKKQPNELQREYKPYGAGTITEREPVGMSKGSPVYSDKTTTNAIDIERERFASKYGTRR